jgi:hypothetical protein
VKFEIAEWRNRVFFFGLLKATMGFVERRECRFFSLFQEINRIIEFIFFFFFQWKYFNKIKLLSLHFFKTSRGVSIEIIERDNYITQGYSLHSFKSSRGVGVDSVERDNIS